MTHLTEDDIYHLENDSQADLRVYVGELRAEIEKLRTRIAEGQEIIARGVELMTVEQVSQWEGVRGWQEIESE